MSGDRGILLGISIGSTRSCVAVYKDDAAQVVANDAGDRVTPCATTLSGKENKLRVATLQELGRQTNTLIHGPLQLLGRSYEDALSSACASRQQCEIADRKGLPVFSLSTDNGSCSFSPADAITAVLAKMKESAKSAAGREDAKDCVIAVPVTFTSEQREALRAAAEKAGLHILRIINEPAAALLAYGVGQQTSPNLGYVLVYDMGGTSINVSIVSVMAGMYNVIATLSNDRLGGKNFDEAVAKHFAVEFQRKWRMDIADNKRSMTKLRAASEMSRQSLSQLNSAPAMVESLYDGMDFQSNLGRARFEGLCGPLLQRCVEPVAEVLQTAGLSASAISKVVVTGGCARTPKLRQLLEGFFNGKAEILSSILPEEVIATGACLQANLLASGTDRDVENQSETQCELPCLSRGLCVALGSADGAVSALKPVLPPSTPIPVREKLSFSVPASQTCAVLTVCEHDSLTVPTDSADVRPVARVVLRDLPVTEGDKEVSVTLAFDRFGALQVSAKEPTSRVSGSVTLAAAQPATSLGVSNGDAAD